MGIKICHLTTVHTRYDIRIFHKECKSLAKAGYDVNLIVADGKGEEQKDSIKISTMKKILTADDNSLLPVSYHYTLSTLLLDCHKQY